MKWLPDMDLNHDKQIQSLLCYRYTIGQTEASGKLKNFAGQSSGQTGRAIRMVSVYASPHPGPLPQGEGEVVPALGENQTLRVADVFHVSRFTQHVS
jgi:hypothetical protein